MRSWRRTCDRRRGAQEQRSNGGYGVSQEGLGATIAGNVVAGAEIGISVSGSSKGHGNLIEDNLVEDSRTGVMIENDFNALYGNGIFESSNSGVAIFGRNGLEATGNVIGGDTPEDENVLAFNGGNAIVIGGVEGSCQGEFSFPLTPEPAPAGVPAPVPSATPIALLRGRVFVKGGRVLVRVICRRGPCGGVLKVFARVPVAGVRKARGSGRAARRTARFALIGKRRLRVVAGAHKVLRIPLNRRGRVLVRRAGRRGLKVRLGGRGVRSRVARLRRFDSKAKRKRAKRAARRPAGRVLGALAVR